MNDKLKHKRGKLIFLLLMITFLLTSCGSDKSHYQAYVKSLITANYLGIPSEYVKLTGANEEDAESLYLQNVTRLADNLSAYYGLEISGDDELAPAMVDLSKQIYGKAKFDVGKPYKDNNIYYVDVTVYPIDIINQCDADMEAYIDKFNAGVDAGDYNNYTKEEYEYEFAGGIIGILADAANEIVYRDPVTVKVRIITADETYYIGNEDLRNIDLAIMATDVKKTEAKNSGDAVAPESTPSDAGDN